MSKYLKSFLVVLLAVAVASPALAEMKVNGYWRLQGIATNSDDSAVNFDGPNSADSNTQTLIDQRLRAKITNPLNDYVNIVWYAEIDGTWGVAGKDGGPGGDRVSVETKNCYLDVKVPNSIVTAKVGLQTIVDNYEGIILFDDWSAAKVGFKLSDAANLTLLYSKPSEGNYFQWDDVNLYNVDLALKAGPADIAADLYWFNNNYYNGKAGSSTAAGAGDSPLFTPDKPFDLYIAGVKGGTKVGEVGINGFFLYAFGGEHNPTGVTTKEKDFSSFAASVAAKAKVGAVALGGRVIYMSGDKNPNDDKYKSWIPNLGGNYDFTHENLMIFLTDAYYNNGPGGRLATNAATMDGVGLLGFTAQANADMGPVYGKLGLGYFMANETPSGVDDQMGFEVAARVGTKIAEKVDCSLNGAYAMLGDYWKDSKGLTSSPDDIWKTTFMINVGY